MDSSLTVSVIIAIIAIIPGVWALVNQARKDRIQNTIDMNKTAQEAALGIIAPLQAELKRMQGRIEELELDLVEKTREIGKLMREAIDKDTKIITLEHQLELMREKLELLETQRRSKGKTKIVPEIDKKAMEKQLKINEEKKEEIQRTTDKTIEQITNGSLAINKNINLEE